MSDTTTTALVLDALTEFDVQVALAWRNTDEVRLGLRTPYMLTREMQAAFYRDVVCNREANARWWAVWWPDHDYEGDRVHRCRHLVAMAGLEGIQWENGLAEMSLLVSPERHGQGVGEQAVYLVLREAFERMRLMIVAAEVYTHNPAIEFWRKMAEKYKASTTILPRRKFWDGGFHDSLLVTFTAEGWKT